jgi:hypothetical protein
MYLNWSQYPIQFSREDQWTNIGNAGLYPLVLDLTIAGMTVTKVLINGEAELNIIFSETLRKVGLDFAGLITPIGVPFYGIVPNKAAIPLRQITLPVTFGTQTNTEPNSFSLKLQTLRHHIMPSLEDQHLLSLWLYLTTHTSCSRCQGLTEYSPFEAI